MRVGSALLVFSLSCSSFDTGESSDGGVSPEGGASASADWTKFDCSAKAHDLCDDMNDGILAKSPPWDQAPSSPEHFTYVSDAVSPPRALRIDDVAGPTSEAGPHLQATLSRPMSALICDVDLRLDAIGPSDSSATLISAVLKADRGPSYTFYLFRVSNGVTVVGRRENDPANADLPLPLPPDVMPTGLWRHVHFEITPANEQPVLISIEGDKPRNVGGGAAFTEPVTTASLTLGFSALSPGWTMLVDNFVCDHR